MSLSPIELRRTNAEQTPRSKGVIGRHASHFENTKITRRMINRSIASFHRSVFTPVLCCLPARNGSHLWRHLVSSVGVEPDVHHFVEYRLRREARRLLHRLLLRFAVGAQRTLELHRRRSVRLRLVATPTVRFGDRPERRRGELADGAERLTDGCRRRQAAVVRVAALVVRVVQPLLVRRARPRLDLPAPVVLDDQHRVGETRVLRRAPAAVRVDRAVFLQDRVSADGVRRRRPFVGAVVERQRLPVRAAVLVHHVRIVQVARLRRRARVAHDPHEPAARLRVAGRRRRCRRRRLLDARVRPTAEEAGEASEPLVLDGLNHVEGVGARAELETTGHALPTPATDNDNTSTTTTTTTTTTCRQTKRASSDLNYINGF